jgi:hypothetical protein
LLTLPVSNGTVRSTLTGTSVTNSLPITVLGTFAISVNYLAETSELITSIGIADTTSLASLSRDTTKAHVITTVQTPETNVTNAFQVLTSMDKENSTSGISTSFSNEVNPSASSFGHLVSTTVSGSIAWNVVPIFQFTVGYKLAEITQDLQSKMIIAIASAIEVNTSTVVLTFSTMGRQLRGLRQLTGVLATVGLKNFQGSPSLFASQLSQDRINLHMIALGLKPILLITIGVTPGCNSIHLLPHNLSISL